MLVEQVYIFLWSIVTGAILGVLFDVFRALRFKGIRDVWVYIQDVIFWLVVAVVIIASAFLINEGELRGYMLIGYALGAGFYMLLFSKFILYIFNGFFGSIRKGIKYTFSFCKKIFDKLKTNKNLNEKHKIRQEI